MAVNTPFNHQYITLQHTYNGQIDGVQTKTITKDALLAEDFIFQTSEHTLEYVFKAPYQVFEPEPFYGANTSE